MAASGPRERLCLIYLNLQLITASKRLTRWNEVLWKTNKITHYPLHSNQSLDKSMVQISVIFPVVRVFQMLLMIAFTYFPRVSSLDPDLVNLRWGSEIYFLKYLPPPTKSPFPKWRWSYSVLGLRTFPATRHLYLLFPLPGLYLPLILQIQPLPIPQTSVFTFSSQKDIPWLLYVLEIVSP